MFFFVFLFFLLILNVFLFTTKKFREDDGGFNCVVNRDPYNGLL